MNQQFGSLLYRLSYKTECAVLKNILKRFPRLYCFLNDTTTINGWDASKKVSCYFFRALNLNNQKGYSKWFLHFGYLAHTPRHSRCRSCTVYYCNIQPEIWKLYTPPVHSRAHILELEVMLLRINCHVIKQSWNIYTAIEADRNLIHMRNNVLKWTALHRSTICSLQTEKCSPKKKVREY